MPEAFYFNAFAFIRLQERIADELAISVGTYTHRSNSMHCYEKDFRLLERYVESIDTKTIDDLTYNYKEFYNDLMLETHDEVMKKVKQLKDNVGLNDYIQRYNDIVIPNQKDSLEDLMPALRLLQPVGLMLLD